MTTIKNSATFSQVTLDHVSDKSRTDKLIFTVNVDSAEIKAELGDGFAGGESVYAMVPQMDAKGNLIGRQKWQLYWQGQKRADGGDIAAKNTDFFEAEASPSQVDPAAIKKYGVLFAFDDAKAGTVSLQSGAKIKPIDQNPGQIGYGQATDADGYSLVDHSLTSKGSMISVWCKSSPQTDGSDGQYNIPMDFKVLYDDRKGTYGGVSSIQAWDKIDGQYGINGQASPTTVLLSQSNNTVFTKNKDGKYEAHFALSTYGEEGYSETQPLDGNFAFFSGDGNLWDSDNGANYKLSF